MLDYDRPEDVAQQRPAASGKPAHCSYEQERAHRSEQETGRVRQKRGHWVGQERGHRVGQERGPARGYRVEQETGGRQDAAEGETALMGNPLHASFYADTVLERQVEIRVNQQVARETYRVRFVCPEIARRVQPGQFLMARIAHCDDPLIGRALAVYDIQPDVHGQPAAIDLIYHVKGKFTTRLASTQPGQQLVVWGPLGNGFPLLACQHLIMVAGGVGQTPFLSLAREHLGRQQFGDPPRQVVPVPRVTLCFGAQSSGFLACVEDFQQLGIDVQLATDDGSAGYHGLVTDLLSRLLDDHHCDTMVASCGPVAMMRRSAELCAVRQVPCYVSLETPMACGIGICFSCVAKVRDQSGEADYKRTCVEGPVFDATRIEW